MLADGVVVVIVTTWTEVYLPADGLNVGAAAAVAAMV
jgi:hypothetical protein